MRVLFDKLCIMAMIAGATMAFGGWPGQAWAYDVPKRTLEERVRLADLVAVVSIKDLDEARGMQPQLATLAIATLLKGHAGPTVRMVFHEGIAELDPECCELGKTYFVMLRRNANGSYSSVDGPYGVFEVNARVLPVRQGA
ncbi:hypothetical protein L2Y96_01645 [Luteibacter aegosomaticola]|uniref:hypothetical protein n=1 Tax=Luteibacter aegosomaticola TaxID=2911538 RepID=UPI001FF75134|nr:hypothetical protein [Luteibacter aegosomaticola]UPG90497.1 hypothetical protein L2Y96_01645 [Luteibacter aegosomaticola]